MATKQGKRTRSHSKSTRPLETRNKRYWEQFHYAESVIIRPPEGYCYLLWFRQLGYAHAETFSVARFLGSNPKLSAVLELMLEHPANLENRLFSDCNIISRRFLHCNPDERPFITWSELISKLFLITRGSFDTHRVGATIEDTVYSDAAISVDILKAAGANVNQIVADHIREESEKPASDLKNLIFKQLIDLSKQRHTAKTLTTVHVPYRLNPHEIALLVNTFPEIKYVFYNNQSHPHALAAIVRKTEEALFMYWLGYRSNTHIPGGCDVHIKDIGGNIRSHLERSRHNVHCCCPILDPRDANRFSETLEYLHERRYTDKYGKYIRELHERNLMYCNHIAQECDVRAAAAIFIHSFYDMSPTAVADSMDRAHAKKAWGSIIFDPAILLATPERDSGVIKSLNMAWTVVFKKRKPTHVQFGFVGDCSYEYRHSYSNYIALLTTAAYISTKGEVYYAEMRHHRFDTYYIYLRKNMAREIPAGILYHRMWMTSMEKFTVVQYYDFNLYAYPRVTQNMFYKINLVVPTRLVEQGKLYAYSLSPQKFSLTSIYEFLRAANSRVIVNGVDVETPKPVDADTLYKLAHALYAYAFVQRYNQSQTLLKITENIKSVRASYAGKFFETIYLKIKNFSLWNWIVGNIDKEPGDIPLNATSEERGILAKIFCWFAVEELLPVDISEAVQYFPYQTILKQQIKEHVTPNYIHNFLNEKETSYDLVIPETIVNVPEVVAENAAREFFGLEKPNNTDEINSNIDSLDGLLDKMNKRSKALRETLDSDSDSGVESPVDSKSDDDDVDDRQPATPEIDDDTEKLVIAEKIKRKLFESDLPESEIRKQVEEEVAKEREQREVEAAKLRATREAEIKARRIVRLKRRSELDKQQPEDIVTDEQILPAVNEDEQPIEENRETPKQEEIKPLPTFQPDPQYLPLKYPEPKPVKPNRKTVNDVLDYDLHECEGLKRVVRTPADGSCMYHAIIGALKLQYDIITLRHKLATFSMVKTDSLKKKIYNEWGDSDVLRIAAQFFMVNICIHEFQYCNTQFIIKPNAKVDKIIHLHLKNNHYSYYTDTDEDYVSQPLKDKIKITQLPTNSYNNLLTPLLRADTVLQTPPYFPLTVLYNSDENKLIVYPDKLYLYVHKENIAEGLKLLAEPCNENKEQRIFVIVNAEALNLDLKKCRNMVRYMTTDTAIRIVLYYSKPSQLVQSINTAFAAPSSAFSYNDKTLYQTLFGSNNIHPEFKPKRRPNDNPLAVMMNAMDEIRSYWKTNELIIRETLTKKYQQLNSKVLSPKDLLHLKESSEGYGLLGNNGKWIQEPAIMKKYECVFNGTDFVLFEEFMSSACPENQGFVLVCDQLVLVQDVKLYKATENLDIEDFRGVCIEFRQGVPGCGKTYNYLQTCRVPNDLSNGDLVLFPTRQGADEFRRDIKKKYPDISDSNLKRNYRTMDSYLLNGSRTERFPRVLVDEALMAHAGQILLCVHKAHATNLIMIGDEKQIKFINRVPQCDIQYSDPCQFVRPTVHLSTSWRCTLTVAALLSDEYEQGMKSVSNVLGEMKMVHINNLTSVVPDEPTTQFLVFKQSEKAQMIAAGFKNTVTVHEYQGKQAAHVAVVRINMKKEDIYSSAPHVLVAISRHTKSFTYFTSTANDKLATLIAKTSKFNSVNCEKYLDKKSGGGIPIQMALFDETPELDTSEAVYSCGRKYGYPLVPLYRLRSTLEHEDETAFRKYLSCDRSIDDIGHVQEFYNYVFPNNAYHCLEFDAERVLTSDLNINLEATSFNPQYKCNPKSIIFDKMRPYLQTSMPASRPSNQIESMLAMVKRNQAVPALAGVVDQQLLAKTLFDRFVDGYLISGARKLFDEYKTRPVTANEYGTSEWLTAQPTGTRDIINQETHFSEQELSTYNFMIKSTVKPQLDHNAPYTYSALQTIAYHNKDINAMFCPIFRELNRRVLPLLKDKFIVNTEMTMQQLETRLKRRLRRRGFKGKRILEIDMSKYDKSQGEAMLLFECMLMEAVGVDQESILLWKNAHTKTILRDRMNKIRCRVNYQRKSGDASTFSGNTFYLMAVIATLIDLNSVEFGIFAGDDSLLVGDDTLDQDLNSVCARLFNLESKFFRQYTNPYFCSKFIIQDEDEYFVVPDPLKLITKLGRRDLVNPEHVEQYRVSLCDIVEHYKNVSIHSLLDKAVNERYSVTGSHSNVYSAVYNIVHNKELFASLYYSLENDNINYDPSLPDVTK